MRYLLLLVGLAGLAFGGLLLLADSERANRVGLLLFLVGTAWAAIGLAAVDIVDAIRRNRGNAAEAGMSSSAGPT